MCALTDVLPNSTKCKRKLERSCKAEGLLMLVQEVLEASHHCDSFSLLPHGMAWSTRILIYRHETYIVPRNTIPLSTWEAVGFFFAMFILSMEFKSVCSSPTDIRMSSDGTARTHAVVSVVLIYSHGSGWVRVT